ncbi:hypothetical protein PUW89_00315 [Metamycoplasma hyosynoviae]|nr:hypothetical protein [Metamycoplasma hyosynoviae]MDD7847301.1 hypothetical protein [Metamycoplasma hyosynoviae]
MFGIDNSLDNCEIEYFFLILKIEIFPNFNKIVKQSKSKIKESIDWYNN